MLQKTSLHTQTNNRTCVVFNNRIILCMISVSAVILRDDIDGSLSHVFHYTRIKMYGVLNDVFNSEFSDISDSDEWIECDYEKSNMQK